MNYPTDEQIEQADQQQLQSWYASLPHPGTSASALPWNRFLPIQQSEVKKLHRICERLTVLRLNNIATLAI